MIAAIWHWEHVNVQKHYARRTRSILVKSVIVIASQNCLIATSWSFRWWGSALSGNDLNNSCLREAAELLHGCEQAGQFPTAFCKQFHPSEHCCLKAFACSHFLGKHRPVTDKFWKLLWCMAKQAMTIAHICGYKTTCKDVPLRKNLKGQSYDWPSFSDYIIITKWCFNVRTEQGGLGGTQTTCMPKLLLAKFSHEKLAF